MYRGFVPGHDVHLLLFPVLIWMLTSFYLISSSTHPKPPECFKTQYAKDSRRREKTCDMDPSPPPEITLPCRNTCYYMKTYRSRRPQRIGYEDAPELLQYPEEPDFTQDTRFCLAFKDLYHTPGQPVTYTVQLGTYSCRLVVWNATGNKGPDTLYVEGDYLSHFGLHLYGVNDRVVIRTAYNRLKFQSWDFNISKSRQSFSPNIADRMGPCLEALVIEGTVRHPQEATTHTDHCVVQSFALSYPQQCTSLTFNGGWKRGQTVTSATWTVARVSDEGDDRCLDIGREEVYDVISEFTDREIFITARELRAGLNRLCNSFLFTATFGPEDSTRNYGPYKFKICGYILVEAKPCIVLKPRVEEGETIVWPFDTPITFDARETIPKDDDPDEYRFNWKCTVRETQSKCSVHPSDESVLTHVIPKSLVGNHLEILLSVLHELGSATVQNTELRVIKVATQFEVIINIKCQSNCNARSVSVTPVVLKAECRFRCDDPGEFEYRWNVTDITVPDRPRVLSGEELNTVVQGGKLQQSIFTTTVAGNVLLERQFSVCVEARKPKAFGAACHKLNYSGAPLPLPKDGCIITPYKAELPGFLFYTYNGLCTWRNNDRSLRYKVYTYDVGVPEQERIYNLIAFSKISRMPDLELPFGNADYDYELGVVFHISNDEGLTYVFDVKEAFKKIGVVFKVRKPSDFTFLAKVENITTILHDEKKSSKFGSRQGVIQVAGLVASVVDHGAESPTSGLKEEKRVEIRESLLDSLVPLASSDVNTARQLTPIMDTLTKREEEISDKVEAQGALVLGRLTAGLALIAQSDYKTAERLSEQQYTVLERFNSRNVVRQHNALLKNQSTMDAKDEFINRSIEYSNMFRNIGTGFVAALLDSDTPRVVSKQTSAIAVKWQRVHSNESLSIAKPTSNGTTFGSTVSLSPDSLNLSAGTEINVIMSVNEDNLFVFGHGAKEVNMPMVSLELQLRDGNHPIHASHLASPVDVFIERAVSSNSSDAWVWQRINVTRPVGPYEFLFPTDVFYAMAQSVSTTIQASDSHAMLLRFNLSHPTFFIIVSIDLVEPAKGNREKIFTFLPYPRTDEMKTFGGVTQDPETFFLPRVVDSNDSYYEVTLNITTVISDDYSEAALYSEEDAPYVMMLVTNLSCLTWNSTDATWSDEGCEATDLSHGEVLHCRCIHLSIFSGGILVPANPVDVLDVELFKEFFKNPAIVSIIVFIWLAYFILVFWAKDEDWLDTFRSRVAVLEDNHVSDEWAYLLCCVTGWWINSSTTARVFIYLKGTRGLSRVHRLTDAEQDLFAKGAENWFILTTPASLGRLKSVVVWHDSSGESPAWFLKEVFVQDINEGHSWHCMYNDWLSVEHGSGDLCVEVPALTPEEMHKKRLYQTILRTSLGFRNGHIWCSIALKPPYSAFTRVQRLTCALCLLLTTMLSNLMFYGIPSTDPKEQASKGPMRMNLRSLVIGVEGALVVMPINMLLVQLFTQTSHKPVARKYPCYAMDQEEMGALEAEAADGSNKQESSESVSDSSDEGAGEDKPHRQHHRRHNHGSEPAPRSHVEDDDDIEEESSLFDSGSSTDSSDSDGKRKSGFSFSSLFSLRRRSTRPSIISDRRRSTRPSIISDRRRSTRPSIISDRRRSTRPSITSDRSNNFLLGRARASGPRFSRNINASSNSAKHEGGTQSSPSLSAVKEAFSSEHPTTSAAQKDRNFSACTDDTDRDINTADPDSADSFTPDQDVQESAGLASSRAVHVPATSAQHYAFAADNLHVDSHVKRSTPSKPVRSSVVNTNNSAIESNTASTSHLPRSERVRSCRPTRRMTQQFSAIAETPWFQTAVTFLRNNLGTMLAERSQPPKQDHKRNSPVPPHPGDKTSKIDTGDVSASYFDQLKEKIRKRSQQQENTISVSSHFYEGGGDWREPQVEEGGPRRSYFDRLKAKRHAQSGPLLDDKVAWNKNNPTRPSKISGTISSAPAPKPCFFCRLIPGQEQTLRHIQALKKQSSNGGRPGSGEQHSSVDKHPCPHTLKGKLKQAARKLTSKSATPKHKGDQASAQKEDPDKVISFEAIRLNHDYEYQRAAQKGARALKAFKRQAAQCIAEDLLNSNRNARWEDEDDDDDDDVDVNMTDGSRRMSDPPSDVVDAASVAVTASFHKAEEEEEEEKKEKEEEEGGQEEQPGGCKSCMKACSSVLMATFLCLFLCRCPRGLPWWTLYLTWTLALFVAMASSWVVMLYGLRLGYQRSVDWLSAFFTGWFQNVAVMQPVKVLVISMLYVIVFHQHINVREEAGIVVHDENHEPLHVAVLKDMEARRKMLDGMWTATDYAYPVPRSKAKDIKLRLEQDARARLILRDAFLWVVFVLMVSVAAQGHTTVTDAFATNTNLRGNLEDGGADGVAFEDIGDSSDVWLYLRYTLLPYLLSNPNRNTGNNVSLVLGTVRVRQLRQISEKDTCTPVIENRYVNELSSSHCLPPYSVLYQESRSFDHSWDKPVGKDENVLEGLQTDTENYTLAQAWLYRSAFTLQEVLVWGKRGMYPGGGYSVELPHNLQGADHILELLNASGWLDQDSRALVVRVNVYTPSKDLITLATVLFEWTQEGPVVPSLYLHTSKLHWYASDYESSTSMAEIGWVLMMSYTMYTEMKEMITVGVSDYLSSPWTYLELLNFFLSLTAIATQMARILIVDHFLDRLVRQGFESYVSFSVPQFLDEILALLRSLIFVLVTLKVFKVLRFNRHFRVLLQSFYIARFSIVNQAMIAFILFMAFGIASLILFGSHLEDYYNLSSTLLALLNFGLGEGDFEGMHESQPVLGPVLYFLFIIVFSTITMSFFVTFILESFTVSRVYVQLNAEEQHVLRYVVRTWRLMVGATPQIRQVRRRRRTHPFKAASFSPKHLMFPDDEPRGQ